MAVTKDEGGGGGGKYKLPAWDEVPKTKGPIPGTKQYKPLPIPAPVPGMKYDPSRLQKTTPYAMPVAVEKAAPAPSSIAVPGARAGRPMPENTEPYEPGAAGGRAAPRYLASPQQQTQQRSEPTLEERPGRERTRRTYQLTWDEYNRLSDEQRAAVDFNTELVRAREKDLNAEQSATPEQLEKFQRQAERMFGEGRGSETFAPETLGVLKDIDFKASGSEDLDDFLGLKSTISAKELKDFSFEREVRPPEVADDWQTAQVRQVISPGGAGGLETDQRAGVYTRNLQEAIARAGELLQTTRATFARSRYDDVLGLGGSPTTPDRARGYGQPKPFVDADADGVSDSYGFNNLAQDVLATLANKQMDPGIAIQSIGTLDAKDTQDIMRYLDEQTNAAIEYGTDVLGIEGKNLRNPVEIRQILGLKNGERRAR